MTKIHSEVYNWLCAMEVIEDIHNTALAEFIELKDIEEEQFLIGVVFIKLVNRICELKKIDYLSIDIGKSHYANTKVNVSLNWNLIISRMAKLGIYIEKELKKNILNGEIEVVIEIMNNIYNRFKKQIEDGVNLTKMVINNKISKGNKYFN